MPTKSMQRICILIMCLGCMLASGCTKNFKPERGAVARKEERIFLANDIPTGTWQTGDLHVAYSLLQKGEDSTLLGTLVFDRNLSDSFPVITQFFFYLTYLDADGRAMETIDISPVIPTFGNMPNSLPLKLTGIRPRGSEAFVFHYYGGFRSNPLNEGGNWTIYHFPFE